MYQTKAILSRNILNELAFPRCAKRSSRTKHPAVSGIEIVAKMTIPPSKEAAVSTHGRWKIFGPSTSSGYAGADAETRSTRILKAARIATETGSLLKATCAHLNLSTEAGQLRALITSLAFH